MEDAVAMSSATSSPPARGTAYAIDILIRGFVPARQPEALGEFASPGPLSARLAAEPFSSTCHVASALAGYQCARYLVPRRPGPPCNAARRGSRVRLAGCRKRRRLLKKIQMRGGVRRPH